MPTVYQIDENGQTSPMTQVYCKDEDLELQAILERNHNLLAGDQINPDEPRRWLLVKREMPVPDPNSGLERWSIDFFFVDQDGVPTFVECKRFADTRSRREVVGQMLDYAANGHYYWKQDEMRGHAARTSRELGKSLAASLCELLQSDVGTYDQFWDKVSSNLEQGQVRLVFFLEEAPFELRSIVDFLNRQMERAEVLIVEARQFQSGDTQIVIPYLFGYTEQARQIKKTITVTTASSRKKKWDETSFLEDARANQSLSCSEYQAVVKLYQFSKEHCDNHSWGASQDHGSFNPKFNRLMPQALYYLRSDGVLSFAMEWVEISAHDLTESVISEIAKCGVVIPKDIATPSFPIGQWAPRVDDLVDALTRLIQKQT